MPRYNLAYLPADKIFSEICIVFAVTHFSDLADGYCLSRSGAFPHITLSQFEAEESQLDPLWQEAIRSVMHPIEIAFHGTDLRPGDGIHTGYAWAELMVRQEPALIACQQSITDIIMEAGLKPLTRSGKGYRPHLTFARLAKVPDVGMPAWPHKAGLKQRHSFNLALGLSNDNGVYLETIRLA